MAYLRLITERDKLIEIRDLDRTQTDIARARGLANSVYMNQELFIFERDHLFAKTWVGLAFESDVPELRSVYPVDFMGMPLLVVKNAEGELKVFHNVCSHRGMHLVTHAGPAKLLLRCPYHSWSYDLDGNLISTPNVGGAGVNSADGFDCAQYGLKEVRARVWLGIIFVNLDNQAPSFETHIETLHRRWEALAGEGALKEVRANAADSRIEIAVNANWKFPVENYCEAYHLPSVHPQLNTYSPLSEHESCEIDEKISGQVSHAYTLSEAVGTKLPVFQSWSADKLAYAEYFSLYPNVLLGIQADHIFTIILQAESATRTLERLQLLYVSDDSISKSYVDCRNEVIESWRTVFAEDVFVVEGMQQGRNSPGFDGGKFSPVMDSATHHFHCWVAKNYRDALT